MLTYGDGVTDLNINELLSFHRGHGKIGTVTGVMPPSRYGELLIENDRVVSFIEKPDYGGSAISGGYFVFNREFFDYLDDGDGCVLEKLPLERLAKEGHLRVFHHNGFWQCMDTFRDYNYLKDMWEKGNPPWKLWQD
jgi:glucose-1-phosphate cytidylyltransferase